MRKLAVLGIAAAMGATALVAAPAHASSADEAALRMFGQMVGAIANANRHRHYYDYGYRPHYYGPAPVHGYGYYAPPPAYHYAPPPPPHAYRGGARRGAHEHWCASNHNNYDPQTNLYESPNGERMACFSPFN